MLLPRTAAEDAIGVAERIREEIEKVRVPTCPRQITMSLGVATWRIAEAPEQFVARADAALYRAKRAGRNCVEAASAVPV